MTFFLPAEYFAFNASPEVIPVRRYCFPAVERGTAALDLARPGLVDVFILRFIKAFKERRNDFGSIALRQPKGVGQ
jgi:hypothetical protein